MNKLKFLNKISTKLICLILSVLLIAMSVIPLGCQPTLKCPHMTRKDWSEDAVVGVNDLMYLSGNTSKDYNPNSYVVTDFDNTASIFDCQETTCIYMIQTMRFSIKPDQLKMVLLHDIPVANDKSICANYFNGTLNDLLDDMVSAYQNLWNNYGPFGADWYDGDYADIISLFSQDQNWQEFASKMQVMYEIVCSKCDSNTSRLWAKNFYFGMTHDQAYNISVGAFDAYAGTTPYDIIVNSPDIPSKTGRFTKTFTLGFTITPNTYELWNTLVANGFDIWVVSASHIDCVRATIDYFGLSDNCCGLLAMCSFVDSEGKMTYPVCSYEGSKYGDTTNNCAECYGYFCRGAHNWASMDTPQMAQPSKEGKVTAIQSAIMPLYEGVGPQAGFMDSAGDYNMCTEFKDMKLVVCFNMASAPVSDGAGLIAATALHQRENLRLDVKRATKNNDTLYVLQGVDGNNAKLRHSLYTIIYGESEEKLLAGEDNYEFLRHIRDLQYSTDDIFNTFTLKTPADKSLVTGIATGFADNYDGYHSK